MNYKLLDRYTWTTGTIVKFWFGSIIKCQWGKIIDRQSGGAISQDEYLIQFGDNEEWIWEDSIDEA